MKIIAFILLISSVVYAQDSNIDERYKNAATQVEKIINSSNAASLANAIIDRYLTWEIKENENGYMLSLDFPYPDMLDPKDYLSLTIVKLKNEERPRVFSLALGTNVDDSKGMMIRFAKHPDINSKEIIMDKELIARAIFDEVNKDFIKIVFAKMKFKELDILKKMKINDFMFFSFYDKNGKQYSLAYPLFKFKDQYENVK